MSSGSSVTEHHLPGTGRHGERVMLKVASSRKGTGAPSSSPTRERLPGSACSPVTKSNTSLGSWLETRLEA